MQISKVAQQQATIAAPAGTFPGQPQPNPKGHANDIILRSGTELDGPTNPRTKNPVMYQNTGKPTKKEDEPKYDEKEDESKEEEEKEKPYVHPLPYKPRVLYP